MIYLLTTKQLAKRLGTNEHTLRSWFIDNGYLVFQWSQLNCKGDHINVYSSPSEFAIVTYDCPSHGRIIKWLPSFFDELKDAFKVVSHA